MTIIIDPLDDDALQTISAIADRCRADVYAWTTGLETIRKNRPEYVQEKPVTTATGDEPDQAR